MNGESNDARRIPLQHLLYLQIPIPSVKTERPSVAATAEPHEGFVGFYGSYTQQ